MTEFLISTAAFQPGVFQVLIQWKFILILILPRSCEEGETVYWDKI